MQKIAGLSVNILGGSLSFQGFYEKVQKKAFEQTKYEKVYKQTNRDKLSGEAKYLKNKERNKHTKCKHTKRKISYKRYIKTNRHEKENQ